MDAMLSLMRRVSILLAVVVLGGLSSQARGEQARKLLAVLPLDAANAKIEQADRALLEESIRTLAGDTLRQQGYTVLNGDNTLALLSDNNIDTSKACEASCSLQAARELKASYFIAGTVATTENQHFAFIRLFDSRNGAQLASMRLKGGRVTDLIDQFDAGASRLFEALGTPPGEVAKVAAPPKSGPRRLAILPFNLSRAELKLDDEGKSAFAALVEDITARELRPSGWTLLTEHDQLRMLNDSGLDASSCAIDCQATIARRFEAWRFMTGSLEYDSGAFIVVVRVVDSDSGRILSTQRVQAETIPALRASFGAMARELFTQSGML